MLLKSTIQVTFFSFLGIIIGFFTQLVVAFYFGATFQRDAYFAAAVIPTYLTTLLTGSIGVIFMSSYIRCQTHKTKEEINLFTSRVLNICGILLISIVIMGIVFSQDLVSIVIPGFKNDQILFTSKLIKILLPTIFFLVLSNLLSTIYQANNRFFLPSITPVLGVIISLLIVFFWSKKIGIVSLAYGTLASSIFNFSVLTQIVFKNKLYRFSLIFEKDIIKMFKIASPLLIVGIFYRSTNIFERMIASTLERGSISYLGYANQLVNILSTIVSGGIATTIFPKMSKEWELNNLDATRKYFAKGMRIVLFVTVPIAIIFICLGDSIVRILFERGAFDVNATKAVNNCLSLMMIAFICLSCGNIVGRAFYISRRTKICAVIASSEILVYLLLGYYLSLNFSYLGLAVALSISTLYNIIVSIFILNKIFKGLDGNKLVLDIIRIIVASILTGLIIYLFNDIILGSLTELFRTGLSIGFGLLCYILVTVYLLPIEEAVNVKDGTIMFIKNKII